MDAMQLVTGGFPPAGLAISALVILGVLLYAKVLLNPLSKIPGPWYSKYTDVVLRKLWLGGGKTQYVHALHEKYGQ